MADEKQLALLRQGPEAWNAWRGEHGTERRPDLRKADVRKTNLRHADLFRADLRKANLAKADLRGTDLGGADLRGTNLGRADLGGANLGGAELFGAELGEAILVSADLRGADLLRANLVGANLREADLGRANLLRAHLAGAELAGANLSGANLLKANLRQAALFETILANVDLGSCKGLASCRHHGPSTIDHRTLQRSGPLPLPFLRGVGLPDALIDQLPSLLQPPLQLHACFLSYSAHDQAFAERLHADLQGRGVRCWLAPLDLPTGARLLDPIDEALRLRDKVLLVLSKAALTNGWLAGEVMRGLDEEGERRHPLLFPIRLDEAVLEAKETWARRLRGQRTMIDFTRWREHEAYRKGLERLLGELQIGTADRPR